MTWLYVAIGGGLGAILRHLMQLTIGRELGTGFPYGTLIVNISGSFIMGLFIAAMARLTPARGEDIRLFVAVGILGGYTTFSSFSLDAIALMEEGRIAATAVYVLTSVVCSLAGLLAGLYLVRAVA